MKKTPLKIFLGMSLAVSLSGCAGANYGNYPTPNAQTCFINPTLVAAKQQGIDNLGFQKAKEGIPVKTLVADYLIPATNKLFIDGNAQPLNALYAQIQPQTLANFMIGCNQVMVQERNQMIKERNQMIKERNQMIKELSTSQHYLNTTPAPQPTYIPTKPQATGTCSLQYFNTHPEIHKAGLAIQYIYTAKPALIYVNTSIARPILGVNSFIHPLTLTGVENTTITTAYTEQKLEEIHQQLQELHQQLQELHQQVQRIKMGINVTPQEILNTAGSNTPGLSGVINYEKAVIASQNGNYMPLIAIYSQVQPPAWRNYFVGCYQLAQKDHATAQVCNTAKACKPKP